MPRFDQTGPAGQGPMTGRRMGRCTNYGAGLKRKETDSKGMPQQENPDDFTGRGMGYGYRHGNFHGLMRGGRGRGMGLQNRFRKGRP